MEDKKILNEEELVSVAGGVNGDGYATVFCCPRDKSHIIVEGNHFGETNRICSRCRTHMQGVVLYNNGTVEQVKEGYEFLLK